MKKNLILLIITSILFQSCIFWEQKSTKNKTDVEKDYIPNKIWTLETNAFYNSRFSRQYGRYYYIQEYDRSTQDRMFYYSKIDLENGKRLWQTKPVYGSIKSYPVQMYLDNTDCILFSDKESTIAVYDESTGIKKATVSFYSSDEEFERYALSIYSWLTVGQSMYWGNFYNDENTHPGLVKLDLSKVDFTKPAEEIQYIKPELVWENPENNQRFFTFPIEKDGIIYFITFNQWEQDDYCFIGAYDTKKETIKWLRKSVTMTGYGNDNMYILDDKLYILEEERGCYELETGKVIWEQRTTQEEYMTSVGVGASMYSLGITYWNGRFYFTNSGGWASSSMTGIPEKYIKNIQCIDAETGKYIWGDLPKDSGSLDTRPIIIDNQCFVVVWDGLRVYNATTGELIGVDKTVASAGKERNAEWDGMFIYFDTDEVSLTSTLIAIKPY